MRHEFTIKRQFQARTGRSNRQHFPPDAIPTVVGRVPRVSRLMALAIHFDQLIRDGVVSDQAELATLGHVSRARLTQIMNLITLAPDLQEALLKLESTRDRTLQISERSL